MTNSIRLVLSIAIALIGYASAHSASTEISSDTISSSSNKTVAIKKALQSTSFGGFVIGKASANNQEGAVHSNFELRLARLYAKGKILDFAYTLQMQVNGIGGSAGEKGPRIVDAWLEWQRLSYLRIKFGQFKRAFMFENPMNPFDIGFGTYAQATTKLAGMSDRCGEHDSNGRDIGVQLQGDLLKIHEHALLHYQVGLWSGNGINHSDNNNHKDLIGGIYIMPIKNLSIGWWGWNGRYKSSSGITVDRKRWSAGANYQGAFTLRGEYVHSYGHKVSDWNATTSEWNNSAKSEGWYVMVGAPVTRNKKLHLHAKVDSYSDYLHLDHSTTKNIYGISAEYWFIKNLKLQLNANVVNDKNAEHQGKDGKYSNIDLQLYWRF